MKVEPPTELEKIILKQFIDYGVFEIKKQGDYKFFGIKWGLLKVMKRNYKQKDILKYINRIEDLLNYGAICEECLSFCKASYTYDEKLIFTCLNCGSEF